MIEMDPRCCAVNSAVYNDVERVCGPETAEQLWYDGAMEYRYDQIQQTGSDELKELVFLITGGVAPGNREKERDAS